MNHFDESLWSAFYSGCVVDTPPPPTHPHTHTTQTLLICGQASAGVDIPFLSGATGETLTAHVPFRLVTRPNSTTNGHATGRVAAPKRTHATEADQVVVTVGDSRHPVRLLVQNGWVTVTVPNTTSVKLAPIAVDGAWHVATVTMDASAGRATVSLDSLPPSTVALGEPLTAVWLYLGEGYRNDDVSDQILSESPPTAHSCALVDLTSMSTEVSLHHNI